MNAPIPTQIVPSARLSKMSPQAVEDEFLGMVDAGLPIRSAGTTKRAPRRLFGAGYVPRFKAQLFDSVFYFSELRQNVDIRFSVTYIVQPTRGGARAAFPRIFYKDVSLVWRSASHFTAEWIGKGDIKPTIEDGYEVMYSAEETTDLPFEIQHAVETVCRHTAEIRRDDKALARVLRQAPVGRVPAYSDFTGPRRRAHANPRNRIHGGRPVAWFTRRHDPESLRFAAGFEPDFGDGGVLEVTATKSRLYGGRVRRFRVLSRNRKIHYLFMAAPRHVWIIPAQALTTELSTYGVRTVDVEAADELFVPGYEYHFVDDSVDPPELISQIPPGFAGAMSEVEPGRCDATAWLDRLPVVREFRRRVLEFSGRRGPGRARTAPAVRA